ncbi:hypothetical protein [Longimicrobium sp.]|uniref:hypothetical protein n=1 Tax=Longimicrobium sp. TaxID=2029185 RepID=UPI002E31E7C5|nr:hypothetical protein [Longimicrobium sp.]HEX6042673.1 hypothetical protein [Longimicrobium sp.]
MNELADGSRVRAALSAQEAKDLAIAVRAMSRRVRDAQAQRKETRTGTGPLAGEAPLLRGEQARALLERCAAARETARYLAASARAARHAAGEQVQWLRGRRADDGVPPARPGESPLAMRQPWHREEER